VFRCGTDESVPYVQTLKGHEKMTEMKYCVNCEEEKPGTGAFCTDCGEPLLDATDEDVSENCLHCGSENPGTGAFCQDCGGKLIATHEDFDDDEEIEESKSVSKKASKKDKTKLALGKAMPPGVGIALFVVGILSAVLGISVIGDANLDNIGFAEIFLFVIIGGGIGMFFAPILCFTNIYKGQCVYCKSDVRMSKDGINAKCKQCGKVSMRNGEWLEKMD
jgi:rRNA maturation endonuclease Nob1